MDGKGRETDNICIERFWRSIKYEEIYLNDYKSINELRYSIDNYMKNITQEDCIQLLEIKHQMRFILKL